MSRMTATISKHGTVSLTTFVQIWTVPSHESQLGLLSTMRRRVAALTSKPGFISMSVHSSDDGKRIAVYAQWRSQAELSAAVASPEPMAGHDELVHWGASDGGATYAVSDVFGPSTHEQTPEVPEHIGLLEQAKQRWAERGFETRVVRVNGVSLHVAEAGQGDPVFLLHGYPQSGEVWRFVAPELAKTHRIIIPDLRGMGLSEPANSGYDLENLAEDLHQLAISLGIETVKVVGHDWGGAVGAVYAMRFGHSVSRLAFLESALAGAGFETLWNFSARNDALSFVPFLLMGEIDSPGDSTADLIEGRETIYLQHLWATSTGDKAAAPFAAWAPYVSAMARPGVAISSSKYYREAYRSAEQVQRLMARKLKIPVLAISGEKGLGQRHEQLVRAFALTVQILIVSGAGHFLAEERPEEIGVALQAFLAE